MTEAPLLQVSELRTGFRSARGTVNAVDGVSFELGRGKTLGIVGESGSGKSVLARSIMGLLTGNSVTTSGQVVLDGRDLSALSSREMEAVWGRDLSIVFQDPMTSLNPVLKIGTQITESLRVHLGLSRREADARAAELLAEVEIPEPKRRLDEYPHQLSGGMRQRVTIAIAIACEPKLLIADEPTTALDVTVQAQILDLLQRERQRRQMSLILVTHDLGVVASRCDEVAVMYAGRFVETAETVDLFREMRMPYTEALFESVPKLSTPSHSRLRVIPGRPPDLAALPPGCAFAPRCSYAAERCTRERPTLQAPDRSDHGFACWYPVQRSASRQTGTPEVVG